MPHLLDKTQTLGRPLVLAHRGLVTQHQENTLAAVKAAMESPFCDGCEFDVFLTKDQRVVLFHDEDMKRLTGLAKNIHEMTWLDLKTLPILDEIEVDGGIRKYAGPERIPLLEEVLEEIRGEDFLLDIELKAYFPKWSLRHTGTEVARIVRDMGVQEQVVCTSFDFFMLYFLEKEARGLISGFAYDDDMPLRRSWVNWLMERNFVGQFIHSDVVCAEHTLIDADTVKKHQRKGRQMGCFTLFPLTPPGEEDRFAHHVQEVQRLRDLGVAWIETDDPRRAMEAVNGRS